MYRNSFFQDAVGVHVATPAIAAEGAIGPYPTGGLKAGLYVDLERREEGTMRTSLVLLIIGGLVAFGAGVLTNPTPAAALEQKIFKKASRLACPDRPDHSLVLHCDKILFTPKGPRTVLRCPANSVDTGPPPKQAASQGFFPQHDGPVAFRRGDQLDIKVRDNPRQVADVREKVARFLSDIGCRASVNGRRRGSQIQKQHIKILDVEYVVIPPSLRAVKQPWPGDGVE